MESDGVNGHEILCVCMYHFFSKNHIYIVCIKYTCRSDHVISKTLERYQMLQTLANYIVQIIQVIKAKN